MKIVSVADITRLYAYDKSDVTGMRRAAALKVLSESWRRHFRARIEKAGGNTAMT